MFTKAAVVLLLVGIVYVQCLPTGVVGTNGINEQLISAREAAINNARYDFGFVINDKIEGLYNARQEHRENGVVRGCYSYDDRYILRTVCYEADRNGFRVLNDERSPSIKAKEPLDGTATVKVFQDGVVSDYVKNIGFDIDPEYVHEAVQSQK